MKKLFLFVLYLSCWTQLFSQSDLNFTPEEKEEAWKLFINVFFPKGMDEFNHPEKFYEDIAYYIVDPREKDSLVLQNLINQIDLLIPQEVYYASSKEEANFIIEISASQEDSLLHVNNNPTIGNKDGYYNNEIKSQHYILESSETRRLPAIGDWALLGLVSGRKPFSARIFINDFSRQSILLVASANLYAGDLHFELSDLDKFILQKLYVEDLDRQVREFIISEYGFWTWLNFLLPLGTLQALKLIVFVFLVILLASLLYWPITHIKFKYQLLNYILKSICLCSTTVCIFLFYYYLNILPNTKLPPNGAFLSMGFETFLKLMITINVAAILFSSFLFFLDHFILSQFRNLFSRFLARTANFVLSILAAALTILVLSRDFSSESLFILTSGCISLIIFGLARSIFFYFKEKNENLIREKDLQLSKLTASKAEAEVASLPARINPHFLYNSLNSIAALAHVDNDKTEKMALSLSELFRHNLNRKNEQFCTIQEEIEAIKAYLEIEQIRFGDRLDYKIEVDETLQEYLIPRNIIQPLVENAIKHGTSKMEKEGRIKLQVCQDGKEMEISVVDNGPKFTEGIISGYGLQSIFDILDLTYKDKAELSWENDPEKRIWINIDIAELKLRKNGI